MTNLHPVMAAALAPFAPQQSSLHTPPRFPVTFCSSCGSAFGPGDAGYSMCRDHRGEVEMEEGYCRSCSGSGEGMHDGSTCYACKGSGSQWYPVEEPDDEDDFEGAPV